jgi:putative addiction module killer protein
MEGLVADKFSFEKKETEIFEEWIKDLTPQAKRVINTYINRVLDGNTSNCKSLGSGVSELKINYQKGYRVYFAMSKNMIFILLNGGHKGTQQTDIKIAKDIKQLLEKRGLI